MSLDPTAARLTALDAIIRADVEERNNLLQLLTSQQALTSALSAPMHSSPPTAALNYSYSGAASDYTGLNAFLLK
jgi:hypothetical protein